MLLHNKNVLMVCAAALMAMTPHLGMAQDASKASVPAPAVLDLPVPTGEKMAGEKMAAPVPAPEPKLVPILDVSNPNAMVAMDAPRVANNNANQRIVTLRDAVAVSVLTNPETESIDNNRRATDEELKQAKALYRPSIDFSADTGYESIYSKPDNTIEGHSDLWRSQASMTLTQMLFDGYSTKYENERQFHRVRSASHRVRESAEFVGLDVIESYLDILRQRELLQISEDNLVQHHQIAKQIEDSASAGRSTRADVEQTKARMSAAEAQRAVVAQALTDAESKFRRRVGGAPQPDLQVPVAPRQLIESNVEDEIKQILTNSPTLDIKEADVNVATAEKEATKSTLYPKVDLQVGASVGDNLSGVEGRTQEGSALLVTKWNLYRGGGDEARTREFVYRQAQAKGERNSTARAIELDARQTWANMISAGKRAVEFRKQADANASVVESYKDQFNLDRRTLLDVLDAQNEWFVSRSNAINNSYLEMFTVYRLLALRGQLLPALQVSYPRGANPDDTSNSKL